MLVVVLFIFSALTVATKWLIAKGTVDPGFIRALALTLPPCPSTKT